MLQVKLRYRVEDLHALDYTVRIRLRYSYRVEGLDALDNGITSQCEIQIQSGRSG